MKGKATIEFFNEDGKLIYKKVEYNKVTNAVSNLVNQNYLVNGITKNGGEIDKVYTPLWKNFAGLLLFTKNLDDTIIPDKNAITYFTGNATDSTHYDSTNVYNGIFDSSSSEITKEKLDLYYTFPLNSVAGDIGSICLTSIQGGNNGLTKGTESLFVSYTNQVLVSGKCGVGLDVPSANYIPYVKVANDGKIVGINEDGNIVTITSNSTTNVTLKVFETSSKVNFTDTFYKMENQADFETIYGSSLDNLPCVSLVSEESIDLPNGFDIDSISLVNNFLYLSNKNNNNFYLYKINIEDFTISYQNTTLDISGVIGYKNVEDYLYITTSDYLYIVNLDEYKESQYLVELTYDRVELVDDDLYPIIFKDTISLLNTKNITRDEERNIYFLTNTNILNKSKIIFDNDCDEIVNFSFNFNEPCFGIITNTNGIETINVNVFSSYLATINNISVQTKYATVVMKVHYELYTDDYKEEQ